MCLSVSDHHRFSSASADPGRSCVEFKYVCAQEFCPHVSEQGRGRSGQEDHPESRWEGGKNNVEGGGGRAKSIISCTLLSAAVKWSPFQTWTAEVSTVFRRDITKREIITGIKLEGLGWPLTQLEWWNTYTIIETTGMEEFWNDMVSGCVCQRAEEM